MKKKYQVFVSSTHKDLIIERQEVIQAILELECIPVTMELFPAANDDAWTLIADLIKDCDYFILILAGKYGTIDNSGISYTEREYLFAEQEKIPIISFLINNPDKLPLDKCEKDAQVIVKLDNFKKIVQQRVVRFWDNHIDLGAKVTRSLIQLINKVPRPGWVKYGESTEEDLKETLKLKDEVISLIKKVNEFKKQEDFYKDIIRNNIVSFGKIIKDTKTALYDGMFDAVELTFKYSDENLNQILDKSLEIITDALVDIINNQIRTKNASENISVSIKAFVNEFNAKKLLEDNLQDSIPPNGSKRYIITLARDSKTKDEFPDREIRKNFFDVKKNSSFNRIGGGEAFFVSNDLISEAENGAYFNETSDWEKHYNATAVVPIYYNVKEIEERQIFGFLAVDSLNVSGEKLFNRKDTVPILEFGAELLTIIFLNLGLFVKKEIDTNGK